MLVFLAAVIIGGRHIARCPGQLELVTIKEKEYSVSMCHEQYLASNRAVMSAPTDTARGEEERQIDGRNVASLSSISVGGHQ